MYLWICICEDVFVNIDDCSQSDMLSKACLLSITETCPAGELFLNGIVVPHDDDLVHNETTSLVCPDGYSGGLHLLCQDGQTSIDEGDCFAHCAEGIIMSEDVVVTHGEIIHNSDTSLLCPDGYSGALIVECVDGETSITEGECLENCVEGIVISGNATVPHGEIFHGHTSTPPCPDGYTSINTNTTGVLTVSCNDGQKAIVEGECVANCGEGFVMSGDFAVTHGLILHG